MREMREGILVYNEDTNRMDIRFDLEEYYGGLHCGEGFEVYINGKWYFTGIELASDWYLSSEELRQLPLEQETFVGHAKIAGLRVRI